MPKKTDRLQLRMNPDLKEWFDGYAEPRGGMSRVVYGHVEELYEQQNGKPWKNTEDTHGTSRTAQEDGAGDGGAGDPEVHRPGPPRSVP